MSAVNRHPKAEVFRLRVEERHSLRSSIHHGAQASLKNRHFESGCLWDSIKEKQIEHSIMLSDQQRKAEISRLKVEARALELGVICSRPSVEGTRYDSILDTAGKLLMVQIKYCDRAAGHASGAVQLRLKSNVRQGAARCYTKDEVDALLVYLPSIDKICFFPQEIFCGRTGLNIRLEPSRNGQSKGCLLARNYFW